MAATLPAPGVQIIQEFRTSHPSIVSPTLVPCVVGACNQVLNVLEDSALNSDTLVSTPVFFTANNAALLGVRYVYVGLDDKHLWLSVSNSPDVEIVFPSGPLTPASVVEAINVALNDNGVYGLLAEVKNEVDEEGAPMVRTFTVRTIATGDLQSLIIGADTDPAVWGVLGFKPGWIYTGCDFYRNYWLTIPPQALPNPRNNLDELQVNSDSIRVFFATNPSNMRELSRSTGFCRRGGTIYAHDDATGDAQTPFVDVPGENFQSFVAPAQIVGTVNLTSPPLGLVGETLVLGNNELPQTLTIINVAPYPLTALIDQLNYFFEDFSFALDGSGHLVIQTADQGQDAVFSTLSGTALSLLGIGYLLGTVDLTTLTYPTALQGKSIILDGVTYTFATGHPASAAELVSLLNTAFPHYTFDQNAGHHLTIQMKGPHGMVLSAPIGDTALVTLGLVAGTYGVQPGVAYPVNANDELFIDGISYGYVNKVAPGGIAYRLQLAKQVTMSNKVSLTGTVDLHAGTTSFTGKTLVLNGVSFTSAGEYANINLLIAGLTAAFPLFVFTAVIDGTAKYLKIANSHTGPVTMSGNACAVLGFTANTYQPVLGSNFYIQGRNLTGAAARPTPELEVYGDTVIIDYALLRNIDGTVHASAASKVYLMYNALRKDVSPAADKPGLLIFDNQTDITNALAPVTAENPLALGLYFALLNCPGTQVTGIGIDETTEDMPEGTVEAFTRAAEFLESVEVYAIAPLSHDKTVAEVYSTHVTTMSNPENKGERICLFSTEVPTRELDVLVASGVGNSMGPNTLDTGIANLSTLLLMAGIPNPIGVIPASYGVFLDVASTNESYSLESVNGSVITIRLSFTGGDNDDGFYAQVPLLFPDKGIPLIDEPFSIKIRGAELLLPTGKPDKNNIALTEQKYAQTFMNRRFWHIIPDKCAATIGGMEEIIESYYLCAAYVGLIAGQPPQQSFTNFPLTGFTRVMGSNDTFSKYQMNIMAAGGNWIVVQESLGASLISRMALTTDMTSVETRTDSITKVVDFSAKVLRAGFKNFIGRFNVTQGFLDSLGHVGQGLLSFLTENGVLIGGNLNNIIQDESNPDTVLVDCLLDPPYPCNYIRLTISI